MHSVYHYRVSGTSVPVTIQRLRGSDEENYDAETVSIQCIGQRRKDQPNGLAKMAV